MPDHIKKSSMVLDRTFQITHKHNQRKKEITYTRIALTPRGHHQQASNHHPCPHMSAHIRNHGEDPSSDSHSDHLVREVHENCTALNHGRSRICVNTFMIYIPIVSNATGV
jgi:hypothetical protein